MLIKTFIFRWIYAFQMCYARSDVEDEISPVAVWRCLLQEVINELKMLLSFDSELLIKAVWDNESSPPLKHALH